ncbi:Kelch repeat-containing protein [Nocardiopsis alba]|uniref:Kelch repeat-containing protein n=1 Tax=Nocardiopsis alba TaxID=53437 RepID=UPI0035E3A171
MTEIRRTFAASSVILTLAASGCHAMPTGNELRSQTTISHIEAPYPEPRRGHSLSSNGSDIFLWGGHSGDQSEAYSDGFIYLGDKQLWHPTPEPDLSPRSSHVSEWVNGEAYIWGGFLGGNSTERFAKDGAAYSVADRTWREIADAPSGRSFALSEISENHLFIAGGTGAEGTAEDLLLYSIEEDEWQAVDLSFPVYQMSLLEGGEVALTGGDGFDPRVAIFNPETLAVSDATPPTFGSDEVYAMGLARGISNGFTILHVGDKNYLHSFDGDHNLTDSTRVSGSVESAPARFHQAPLGVGSMWHLTDTLTSSASDSEMFLIEENGRADRIPRSDLLNCRNDPTSVRINGGFAMLGGLECPDEAFGYTFSLNK